MGKGHYHCNASWWRRPTGLLSRAVRLAYSFTLDPTDAATRRLLADEDEHYGPVLAAAPGEYPNLWSVPYPSSVHWPPSHGDGATHDPTRALNARSTFALFMGSLAHGDVPVRREIQRQCGSAARAAAPERARGCTLSPGDNASQLVAKARSIFCLEPGGDSPFRKSLSDSIAFGCIPVLFSNLTDAVAPWFWGAWRHEARVLVPRAPFVAGQIDLLALLRQYAAPHTLGPMQRTLARRKKAFQFSLGDDEGDAVDVLLRGVLAASRDLAP